MFEGGNVRLSSWNFRSGDCTCLWGRCLLYCRLLYCFRCCPRCLSLDGSVAEAVLGRFYRLRLSHLHRSSCGGLRRLSVPGTLVHYVPQVPATGKEIHSTHSRLVEAVNHPASLRVGSVTERGFLKSMSTGHLPVGQLGALRVMLAEISAQQRPSHDVLKSYIWRSGLLSLPPFRRILLPVQPLVVGEFDCFSTASVVAVVFAEFQWSPRYPFLHGSVDLTLWHVCGVFSSTRVYEVHRLEAL